MTVSSTLNKVTIAGNGATTAFPFNFAMPGVPVSQASAFLIVTVVNSLGVSTVVPFGPGSSQYQLTLNAPISPSPTPVGGIVTYNPLGAPIPTGSTLTIQRVLPENQLVSLSGQGTLWPTVVETALDYLTMTVQQLQNTFGNFFQAPATDPPGLNYTAPAAAQRASQALGFDSLGNLATFTVLPAGTVSSAMAPVVNAVSLAAGRTAFGLGAMATEGIGGGLQDDGASNARVFFAINKINISTTISSVNFLQKIKATGPITFTLPRANTLWPGFGFWIEVLTASAGVVTLTPNAADQIESSASGASVTIPVGSFIYISTDGATNAVWYVEQVLQPAASNPTPPGLSSRFTALVTNGAIGNNTVTVSAAFVAVSDGVNFYTVTPTGGINFGTAGAGGLDTGSIAQANWYYIWAIYNPVSTVANWLVSLSSTTPTMPAGFTSKGLCGVLRTAPAAAALMGTTQFGNSVDYVPGLGQTTPGVPNVATGSGANVNVPLTATVPPNAKSYRIYIFGPALGIASEQQISVAPVAYASLPSTTNPPPLVLGSQQSGTVGFAAVAAQGTFVGTGPVTYNSSWGAGSGAWIQGFDLNL